MTNNSIVDNNCYKNLTAFSLLRLWRFAPWGHWKSCTDALKWKHAFFWPK